MSSNDTTSNKEIAALLDEIAQLLELSGESSFKSRAYTNVARQVEQSEESVAELAREGRLRELKGVGDALEDKITEFVETGALAYRDNLRAEFPETLFDLLKIPGLGAKRVRQLYEELEIDSLDGLEAACEDGRVDTLKGFGKKMQEKILQGIAFSREHANQFLLDVATREADRIVAILSELPETESIELAGSLRRSKEIVKDLDIIAASESPEVLMDAFVGVEGVHHVTGHGSTKSSIVLDSGIGADLRVVDPAQYASALMHFTGSKEHNVAMRQRAKERDLKLSEYGLFDGDNVLPCDSEEAIYGKLDLPWIPPEMREDNGEFELKKTPSLVERGDLKGVVHCHSTYSDGKDTLADMAKAAKAEGYGYIVMADHSQSAAYAGGLEPARVKKQHKEIDALNKELGRFRIIKGIESDIRTDGSLDYEDDVLDTFEAIIASVHSKLEMDEDEATARVIRAVEDPHTTILGHPTGRLLLRRKGFPLDFPKVFDACAANRVAIEINANCRRLDLDWRLIRRAKEAGCMFSIGPDAHRVEGLQDVRYGLGIARKGWLEKSDLLNSLTAKQFLAWKDG